MGYFYRYRRDSEFKERVEDELSQAETLRSIEATISALTGGCEICIYGAGLFCRKHKRPVKAGDPRCADFARRFADIPAAKSKAQAQEFIMETLGFDAKSAGRLLGTP